MPLYFHFQDCEILNFESENIIIYTLKFLFSNTLNILITMVYLKQKCLRRIEK